MSVRWPRWQTLGAAVIRVFTGYSPDPACHQADWDKCVRGIREAAAVAQTFGVTLAVQNHHDVGVGVEAFAEFLDDVGHPSCKAAFDPWAPALHGSESRSWLRRLALRMAMTTLADYVRLPRFGYVNSLINYLPLPAAVRAVPLGDGFVDLALCRTQGRRVCRGGLVRNVFAAARRRQRSQPRCLRRQGSGADSAVDVTMKLTHKSPTNREKQLPGSRHFHVLCLRLCGSIRLNHRDTEAQRRQIRISLLRCGLANGQ